ncbi:MAG TPA: hypothetical protein GX747_01475 [Tenericutes bacterium]|nr:hypothetical protein [Mycoplasmatota bacterium]
MNIYLLQLVGKWASFIVVTFISLFSNGYANLKEVITINNDNLTKNMNVVNRIIDHETEIVYNSKLPSNIKRVITEGVDGIITDSEEPVIIREPITEVIEQGTGKAGQYKGILTGYGPDCDSCDGKGIVACRSKSKKAYNLITDGIYYSDDTYGKVRILAADLSEFPCGTIVYVDNGRLEPFYGVILDTGIDMRKAYRNGIIHMDLAYSTETDQAVYKATNKSGNVVFNVQRWGW